MDERYVRVLIGIRLALGLILAFSLFFCSPSRAVCFRKSYHKYELKRRNENNRKNKNRSGRYDLIGTDNGPKSISLFYAPRRSSPILLIMTLFCVSCARA